jgi:thioredoxin 1
MTELHAENFQSELHKTPKSIVLFGSPYCGPCGKQKPIIEDLDVDLKKFYVNIEDLPHLADVYKINSLLTIMIFENSSPIESVSGLQSSEKLKTLINRV